MHTDDWKWLGRICLWSFGSTADGNSYIPHTQSLLVSHVPASASPSVANHRWQLQKRAGEKLYKTQQHENIFVDVISDAVAEFTFAREYAKSSICKDHFEYDYAVGYRRQEITIG